MSGLRPAFRRALVSLAEAFAVLGAPHQPLPIVVGGAAVEFHTGSAFMTGDIDLVAASQEAAESALIQAGFMKPSGASISTRGWVHPDLDFGVEIVSGRLMDGLADVSRVTEIAFGQNVLRVMSLEDLIADRLGQHFSDRRHNSEMLQQAIRLWLLADDPDEAYLHQRITEETGGDAGLHWLKGRANEAHHD